jgi:hypothetical protein
MDVDRLAVDIGTLNANEKKKGKCYKCDREGHFSKECFATTKADGTPLSKGKPRKGKFGGKKKFKKRKGKGRFIRSNEVESGSEEEVDEEDEQQEEVEEEDLEINSIQKIIGNMDDNTKQKFRKALKKDFQK